METNPWDIKTLNAPDNVSILPENKPEEVSVTGETSPEPTESVTLLSSAASDDTDCTNEFEFYFYR